MGLANFDNSMWSCGKKNHLKVHLDKLFTVTVEKNLIDSAS